MSNDATVRFGYDGTALNRGLAESERKIKTFAGNADRALSRPAGGKRNAYLGNVSMQVQDIAVQLQAGTKLSTVIAQQGSQMLSAFGTGGAVLGGLLAVGGALYMVKQKGEEAFEALKTESSDFDKTLRHISVGSITDMIDGMEQMKKRAKELREEVGSASSGGFMNGLKRFFSSSTFDAQTGAWTNSRDSETATKAGLARRNEEGRAKIIQQILVTSDDELRIQQLKLEGRQAEADELERQLRLRREIAKLEDAPEEVRARLIANLQMSSELEKQANAMERQNKLARERDDIEKRRTERESARNNVMADVEVLRLRAHGHEKQAKALERKLQIEAETARIVKETGASEEQARKIAEEKVRLQDKINGVRHIGGVRESRRMTSGLNQFYRNQQKTETNMADRARPGYARGDFVPAHNAFDIPLTTAQRRGRMMGGADGGSLADRGRRTVGGISADVAAAQQQKSSTGADLSAKLDKTNELLSRGLLGR